MATVLTRTHHLVGRFFAWWLAELTALVPRRLRRLARPGAPILVVEPSRGEVRFRLFRGERAREVGRVNLEGKDALEQRRAVAAAAKPVSLSKTEVALRLPAEQALRRTLDLPWMTDSDLRQALFFQIDRQTPFAPEEVCFDYRVSGRDPGAKRVTVEMTVVPRRVVDDAVAVASGWGLRPAIVDVAGEDPDAAPVLNLLSEAGEPAAKTWSPLNTALALVALGLAALLVYVPLDRQRTAAETLVARVAEAQAQADEVIHLREEVERLDRESRFLAEEKRDYASVLAILDELTKTLPDHTWLFELKIQGREVRIAGYSSAASRLIGVIGNSSLFETPRFRSSVTQDPRSGLERFNLSFEIAERGGER
ncbi:MAG: PilN domain-containing protein [Alphaproteobacteria bacterium]